MDRFKMGQISARDAARLNELWEAVSALKRMTVAPPLSITRQAGVPVISMPFSQPVLAVITGNDAATPPVHSALRQTRDGSTNVTTDYVPDLTYEQVLNPLGFEIPTGSPVELVPIADYIGWWWAFPVAVAGDCGSGSGSGTPYKWNYDSFCVEGHVQVWRQPEYQDACTKTNSVGAWEFDRFEGCCDCGDPPSGSGGYDCFNGDCVPGSTYPTLAECQAYCEGIASYDCVSGACVETVGGAYETLGECEQNCGTLPCTGPFCDTYTLTGLNIAGSPRTLTRSCSYLGITTHWTDGEYHLFTDDIGDQWSVHWPAPMEAATCTWQFAGVWDGTGTQTFTKTHGACPDDTVTVACTGAVTDCCASYSIPGTLYLTFSGGTGGQTVFDNVTVTLTYSASTANCGGGSALTDVWYGEFVLSAVTYSVALKCEAGVWGISGSDCDGGLAGVCLMAGTEGTASCDPLLVTGTSNGYGAGGTCPAAGTLDWTVSETAP